MSRYCLVLLTIGFAGLAQAQNAPLSHALLTHKNNKLIVQANNSRPVEQTLAELRREYGMVLDYEEGESDSPARVSDVGNRKRWIGGSYTIKVNEPASNSFADSKYFVTDVLSQFSTNGSQQFTTIIGANNRITVSPSNRTHIGHRYHSSICGQNYRPDH